MAGPQTPGRKPSGRDTETIRQRLDDLGERIGEARGRREQPRPEPQARGAALSQALRLATELIAGVGVGGFIGWWLDHLLGTAPFLMVLFLVLGAVAGILNVMRAAQAMQGTAPLPGKDLGPDDDDD